MKDDTYSCLNNNTEKLFYKKMLIALKSADTIITSARINIFPHVDNAYYSLRRNFFDELLKPFISFSSVNSGISSDYNHPYHYKCTIKNVSIENLKKVNKIEIIDINE